MLFFINGDRNCELALLGGLLGVLYGILGVLGVLFFVMVSGVAGVLTTSEDLFANGDLKGCLALLEVPARACCS